MRSILLITATLMILVGGFFVYWRMQPSTPAVQSLKSQQHDPIPTIAPTTQGYGAMKEGTGAWFEEFDETTGRLTRKFRAEHYSPQQSGTVLVDKPEVWFYGANQQTMQVIGTDGEVEVKNPPELTAKNTDNAPPAPPSRGRLNHVIVNMFSASSAPGVPDEVLTTNNIQFDNDTLLITTERFTDAAGQNIARDQVPVHVRGKYDFDGRGLTMRWNDHDGRLEMLNIKHGEQLVVKDTSNISGLSTMNGGGAPRPARSPLGSSISPSSGTPGEGWGGGSVRGAYSANGPHPSPPPEYRRREQDFWPNPLFAPAVPTAMLPIMLASADPAAARQAIQPSNRARSATRPTTRAARGQAKTKTPAATGPTPYLATFNDDVRITQGDTVLAVADKMDVDFVTKSDADKSTTQPATSQRSSETVASAATLPSAPSTAPATRASTQPTTKPAQPPVVIKWTGELTIYPAPVNRVLPLASGSAMIWLYGRPAAILRAIPEEHKRQDIRAATIAYNTGDGSVLLDSSPEARDVILKQFTDGKPDPTATLISRSVHQFPAQHLAILDGPGRVIMPADDRAPDKGNLDAKWAKQAKVFLFGGATGETREIAIDHMELLGDVDVEHPQLSMQSQQLAIYFDSGAGATTRPATRRTAQATTNPTTQPDRERQIEIKRIFATTAVHARLLDAQGKYQTIDGDELELLTARGTDGQIHPRQVNATGKVHAFDDAQDLRAQNLQFTLRQAPDAAKSQEQRRRGATQPATTQPGTTQRATTQPATTQPAEMQLERMLAIGDVIATSRNENSETSTATGDRLEVTMENDEPHVRLSSTAGNAQIIDAKKNIITGPLITAQTKRQLAHIEGPGSIVGSTDEKPGTPQKPGETPRKVNVAWKTRADFNGPANAIDAFGGITFETVESDGTRDVATSDLVHVDLEDKPAATTQPTGPTRPTAATQPTGAIRPARPTTPSAVTRPALAATNPATAPAKSGITSAMKMDPMGQKQMKRVILDGGAQIISTLTDGHDGLLRRRTIKGPTIIYGLQGSGREQTIFVLVPSAGNMLLENYGDPDKRSANANDVTGGMEGSRGQTLFAWKEKFFYNEELHLAEMDKDVAVINRPADSNDKSPMVINAASVKAYFEPAREKAPARPATRAATSQPVATRPVATRPATPGPADPSTSMQLQKVIASGDARTPATVNHDGNTLTAHELTFDPLTHWVTAKGTPANPAVYTSASGTNSTHAETLSWNTLTWNIRLGNASMQGQGR
ncbi:MAG TPA: hypothetical protein VH370_20950 [Humisphaera sp.]|jgi:lipopolysaccharide export system protein LptA|nr:hypothetical protein [Humisphaera sp.]